LAERKVWTKWSPTTRFFQLSDFKGCSPLPLRNAQYRRDHATVGQVRDTFREVAAEIGHASIRFFLSCLFCDTGNTWTVALEIVEGVPILYFPHCRQMRICARRFCIAFKDPLPQIHLSIEPSYPWHTRHTLPLEVGGEYVMDVEGPLIFCARCAGNGDFV
jgi:hypothetical protein